MVYLKENDKIKIELLKEGMVFNSYRDLCNHLEVKPTTGEAKEKFMDELDKYCVREKIPNTNKIRIVSVNEEPIEKDPDFMILIIENLCSLFCSQYQKTGVAQIDITFKNLITDLCFVNERYKSHSFDPMKLNSILELEEKNPISIYFFQFVNSRTRYYVNTAIKFLEDRKLMKMYKRMWVYKKEWEPATDPELQQIVKYEKQALESIKKEYSLPIEGISDVMRFGFIKEYSERYENLIRRNCSFSMNAEFYQFVFSDYIEKYYKQTKLPQEKFIELNEKFMKYIDKYTLKQFEKLMDIKWFGDKPFMGGDKKTETGALLPFRDTYVKDREKLKTFTISR